MTKTLFFGRSRVCGVIAAHTASDAWHQVRRALRCTDTIELRLDWFANANEIQRFFALLKRTDISHRATMIATCRRRDAGGKFCGSVEAQLSLLRSAIDAGCRWVDLEIESIAAVPPFTLDLFTSRAKRIVSYHDFHGTPPSPDLARLMRRLNQVSEMAGCDAIKIATKCDSLKASLRLFTLARQRSNTIIVPMGEIATPARVLAPRFGSALSYAPAADATAPGQIPLAELHEVYRGGDIGPATRVYGVIGNPVAHSLSPVLHNAGFRARKIDAIYLPFRVLALSDLLSAIELLGIAGFSITLPFKEQILTHLDYVDPVAESIGAANTVVVRARKKLFGYNTDSLAILRALEGRLQIRASRVLILGAGGAARAAAFALARAGALIAICSRRPKRARHLAHVVHGESIARDVLRKMSFDAIINATPVGMHPRENESPIALRELNCRLAFDTVYRPRKTKFLRLAAKRGIETVSGLEMFLAQGIAQWEMWTGQTAPAAAMRRAVLKAVRRDEQEIAK